MASGEEDDRNALDSGKLLLVVSENQERVDHAGSGPAAGRDWHEKLPPVLDRKPIAAHLSLM